MAEHTPGPWKITGSNIRSDNHKDGSGALLFVQQDPFDDYEPDPEEQAANLRLAAAAPNLLAIVEGFIGTLDADDLEVEAVARSYYKSNIALFNLAIETSRLLRGTQLP